MALKIFYCYARKDQVLRDELDRHLAALLHSDLITSWYDGAILAGFPWEQEIEAHLSSANVILLLISANFVASDYAYHKEMARAIERHQAGEARVIPILLRPVEWSGTPFASLKMLPTNALPVTSWANRDEAFQNIAQGIRHAVLDYLVQQVKEQAQQASQGKSASQQEMSVPRQPHPRTPDITSSHPIARSPQYHVQVLPAPSRSAKGRRFPGGHLRTFWLLSLGSLFLLLIFSGIFFAFRAARSQTTSLHISPTATSISAVATYHSYDTYVQGQGAQSKFNAAHTSFNSYEHILTPLNVPHLVQGWTALTNMPILSSPVVANGIVYIGSYDHYLYAFNASGCPSSPCQPLWTAQTGSAIASSPAVVNGVVYIGSTDGNLYAFAASGCHFSPCRPLWEAQIGGAISASPTIANGTISASPTIANGIVYMSSTDGSLYAFNASGCKALICQPLWTTRPGNAFSASPAVADGIAYVGSFNHSLYAFNASGCPHSPCQPLWTAQTGDAIEDSPVVANGMVYVSSFDHVLYAFRASGCPRSPCQPLWTTRASERIEASPAVVNGVIYVGDDNGNLDAFHASGCPRSPCQPLWSARVGNFITLSPTVANGVIYAGAYDGELDAFDTKGCPSPPCHPLWTTQFSDVISSPVVANGVVYIGAGNGKLYTFHVKP